MPHLCFVAWEPSMSNTADLDATGAYHPPPPAPPAGERFAPGALLVGWYRVVTAPGKLGWASSSDAGRPIGSSGG
jgi:hypothetical protein